jgi:hypothetical protein
LGKSKEKIPREPLLDLHSNHGWLSADTEI